MPLYYFKCQACLESRRKLLTPAQSKEQQVCDCGGSLERTPKAPTMRVTEHLDNGVMVKALERLADAENLYKEHSKHDPNKPLDII